NLATTEGYDVIADCGRLAVPNSPLPLLVAADTVLLALRPTLPGMSAAIPAVRALRHHLVEHTGDHRTLRLLLVGRGDQTGRTVARELDTPVAAWLPDDPRSASILSSGGRLHPQARLLRTAATCHRDLASPVPPARVEAMTGDH